MDELGNVKGGMRLPYLEVPAYHFKTDATASPLEPEILAKLYNGKEDYVEKVKNSVQSCLEKKLLIKEDADAIIQEAENCTFWNK